MSSRILVILLLCYCLCLETYPFNFKFKRSTHCVMETTNGCVHWESKIDFEKPLDASCFPQETYLQGRDGKIPISQLKVGDEVLVYNSQEGSPVFEPIVAWLHRQQNSQFEYQFVQYETQELGNKESIENSLYISAKHNIASIRPQDSEVNYVFAQNLSEGDFLFGKGPYSGSISPKIAEISSGQTKRGVYAPYTHSGNFYISGEKESEQLILVHCFAHVSPEYHSLFDWLISLNQSWNTQPQNDEMYIHPLGSYLKSMFPSVVEMRQLKHLAHEHLNEASNSEFRTVSQGNEFEDFEAERIILLMFDKMISSVLMWF